MEFIDTKCPNCGAELRINKEEKTGFCSHCNSSFLIEDAIKNYVTNNSYKIEHATILNSEGDVVLYNEVDRYIALCSLEDYDRLESVVENLKTQFPHKGIARIVVLNYEFLEFFSKVGIDQFKTEANEIELRYNSYEPKSYKNPPPHTSFFDDLGKIELKYSENIDELLTEAEKEKYSNLVQSTKDNLSDYIKICLYNDKMDEKFAPFREKYNKKQARKRKFKEKPLLKIGFFALIAVALVCVISLVVFASNYIFFRKSYASISDINNLDAPVKTTASTSVFVKEISGASVIFEPKYSYTITGRVTGKKSLFSFDVDTKIMPTMLFLTWGALSTKEKTSQISWSCNLKGQPSYSWNLKLGTSDYISTYSSNNRLAPADNHVKKAIMNIKKNDVVQIKGYLVDVRIKNKDSYYRYTTSTSLFDDSYEIVYVTEVLWIK